MNIDQYYKQLEGAKILKYCGQLGTDEYSLNGFPTFIVKLENGKTMKVEVSRDEEGNDGGFLFQSPATILIEGK